MIPNTSNARPAYVVNQSSTSSVFPSSFSTHADSVLEERTCDFILCMGDDRTDEYMFEYLHKIIDNQSGQKRGFADSVLSFEEELNSPKTRLFTCTVGVKSSSAQWHVSNVSDALKGLELLANL